jgi:Uma2 family endonuclease
MKEGLEVNVQPQYMKMSVEDYLKLDEESEERYEYIDGYAYMLAGGSTDHSAISANVIGALWSSLRGSSCHVHTSDGKVRLSDRRFVYPDITVSCDERDRHQKQLKYPVLVVEVLSPGTQSYDRGDKGRYYRAYPTLQEYLLVDSQHRLVELYRRANANMWTLYIYGPNDKIELKSIGITLAMADIYEGVFLEDEDSSE